MCVSLVRFFGTCQRNEHCFGQIANTAQSHGFVCRRGQPLRVALRRPTSPYTGEAGDADCRATFPSRGRLRGPGASGGRSLRAPLRHALRRATSPQRGEARDARHCRALRTLLFHAQKAAGRGNARRLAVFYRSKNQSTFSRKRNTTRREAAISTVPSAAYTGSS